MAQQRPTVDIPGVTILGVVAGYTTNNKPKFDVQCQTPQGAQEYTCFDAGRASKAQAGVNTGVGTLRVSVNGTYQNFEDFFPGQGAAVAGAPVPVPAPVAAQQQFTPAPDFVDAKAEAKLIEMRRVGGVQNATNVLGPLVGSGFYVDDDGKLDLERVTADVVALAGKFAGYTVHGPAGPPPVAAPAETPQAAAAELPPGVSPEDVAKWVAANGAGEAVQVGAPTAAAEATTLY